MAAARASAQVCAFFTPCDSIEDDETSTLFATFEVEGEHAKVIVESLPTFMETTLENRRSAEDEVKATASSGKAFEDIPSFSYNILVYMLYTLSESEVGVKSIQRNVKNHVFHVHSAETVRVGPPRSGAIKVVGDATHDAHVSAVMYFTD